MTLGECIRIRRMQIGMSQQELADALGYKTRSSIAKLEKDQSKISHEKLVSMAHILKTSPSALLEGMPFTTVSSPATILSNVDFDRLNHGEHEENKKCSAVILAGGKNRVNRYNIPYQFVSVKDKPVIIYTMEAFQRHPLIDEIHVVCLEGWEDFLRPYANKYGITKLKEIIPAGTTGIQSVKNAVEWLTPTHNAFDILLVQEATRPFIDPETISNAILCCRKYGNAIVFERMDRLTPFLMDKNGAGLSHLNANELINVQSPEVYTIGALRQAFNEAISAGHTFDETICSVFMYHMGRKLKFCEGSHNNFRIVYDEDIKIMEALIK